jgi:hypothetical protein
VSIVDKHRAAELISIRDGTSFYAEHGRVGPARTYDEFGNWLRNLSYAQFVKLKGLGQCITRAMVDSIGHSISARYDRDELPRMRFLIDRDFIKQPHHDLFWHEVLRNQLYSNSLTDPIPMANSWKKRGHPFLKMYTGDDGETNYNELFTEHCAFGLFHEHFELRIADMVAAILYRAWNGRGCRDAYGALVPCFARDRMILGIALRDFDLDDYRYDRNDNPWMRKWLSRDPETPGDMESGHDQSGPIGPIGSALVPSD